MGDVFGNNVISANSSNIRNYTDVTFGTGATVSAFISKSPDMSGFHSYFLNALSIGTSSNSTRPLHVVRNNTNNGSKFEDQTVEIRNDSGLNNYLALSITGTI